MKKIFLLFLILTLLLPIGLFASEELELGIALTPIGVVRDQEEDEAPETVDDPDSEEEQDFFDNWLLALHAAYNWDSWYVSLDAVILAPWFVKGMTTTRIDDPDNPSDAKVTQGIYAPGLLFFIDGGLKVEIGNFIGFGELGFNWLYVYKGMAAGKFGTNLRLGARYKFTDYMSVGLTGTAIFPDFASMFRTIGDSFSEDDLVREAAGERMKFVPMLALTMHL